MEFIICNWTNYKGSHCRRNIQHLTNDQNRLCPVHAELIKEYTLLDKDKNELCDSCEDLKIVPRSYKHVKSIMNSVGNEDDTVIVSLPGGSQEEADVSDEQYITLLSDDTKYYYTNLAGRNKEKYKANSLKVLLKRYCDNVAVVSFGDVKYCETCYKKLKNVPKYAVLEKCCDN